MPYTPRNPPATGTAGTYSLTITASNGVMPAATQTFTLNVVAPQAGYVAYPAYYAALPGPNCFWTRRPVYDAYGNVVGWRGRPVAVCR